MEDIYKFCLDLKDNLEIFLKEFSKFIIFKLRLSFIRFEKGKNVFVASLYRQRGKLSRRFIHMGMASISALGVMIAPVIAQEFPGKSVDPWDIPSSTDIISSTKLEEKTSTVISEKLRDKVIEYEVKEGDTLSSIAQKFGITEETILWENDLPNKNSIKVGQKLRILPVSGISHKVQKGDTVYSIAKKYDSSPQAIVDFPFNTFVNDETFELAVGQEIIVPDGVKPKDGVVPRVRKTVPNAGTALASGNFVWPAGGQITQNFSWYHPGIDIANKNAPDIVAADSGTVEYAGCLKYGYGCHVIINHKNGHKTLYAHLSSIYVEVGQGVQRGVAIGKMGSTGRSTGTHLHFEIIREGGKVNPLSVLK